MKRIKAVNGYTIYQASARDVSKYNVEEGYFYLYFSSDIRDYGLSNCDWDWEAGSIEEAEAFATGTNYAVAKEIVEETTTAASFEEILEVEAKLDNGISREEIEEESDEEPTPIEAKIRNAIEFCTRMETRYSTYRDMENDAANLFSDTFEEYMTIANALEQKRMNRKTMSVYDFLIFFDEEDDGQHRYVAAYSEEEATQKLETHYKALAQEGIQYPAFICNPILHLELTA